MPIRSAPGKRLIELTALIALPFVLSGCAFLNRDNTPTFNWVEKHLWPEGSGKRALAFPVVFPLGFAAVVTDAFVVHPVTVIDDAADDTRRALWEEFDWDQHYLTECAALPWRTVATPIMFTGDFLGRSLFDVSNAAEHSNSNDGLQKTGKNRDKKLAEAYEKARELLKQDKPSEALDVLLEVAENYHSLVFEYGQQQLVLGLLLEASFRSRRYEALDYLHAYSRGETLSKENVTLLQEMAKSNDPMARWHANELEWNSKQAGGRLTEILIAPLADPNPIVRFRGLSRIREYAEKREKIGGSAVIAPLENIAKNDPDPYLQGEAAELLSMIQAQHPAAH